MADDPMREDHELLYDGNRGIYLPQAFANDIVRERVSGVSNEDYAILAAGPDHEWYWESWISVLDNAVIKTPDGREFTLHQDGDLWAIPSDWTSSDWENVFGI